MSKRYSVSIEVCHILTREAADKLAGEIKHKLGTINEDVYICVADYEQVQARQEMRLMPRYMDEAKP